MSARRPVWMVRNPVFARLLAGTVLAVLCAQLAGVGHVLASRASPPLEVWQGAADAAAQALVAGLDAVPADAQRAEVLRRAAARGWRARVAPAGTLSGPPPRQMAPPTPNARVVLGSGEVLIVDAPGWQAPAFTLALVAGITLSVAGVGGVVLLLGAPLARDLDRLRATLHRLGDEDLSARVGALRTRDVAPVGEAIDAMADRVQTLVEGQRTLLQTVSHELRTPHARLRFHLERLAGAEGPEARDAIHAAVEQDLDEVDALLTELLAYVRADAAPRADGSAPAGTDDATALDVADWLVDVVERADLGESAVQVRLEVAPDLPLPLAPRAWFARAVGNIVRNARRHARSAVEVRARIVPGHRLEVTVDDDGPGIAPRERERLLQPFEVGDGRPGSLGLGLAIASRILARAGGGLHLDTAPIGGARVTTTWPLRPAAASRR